MRLSLTLTTLILTFGALQSAHASLWKCTAYCGEAQTEIVGQTERERCRGDVWSKSCGGIDIKKTIYGKVNRFRLVSNTYRAGDLESAYQQFAESCQRNYSAPSVIFRKFTTDQQSIEMPDVDTVLATCKGVSE